MFLASFLYTPHQLSWGNMTGAIRAFPMQSLDLITRLHPLMGPQVEPRPTGKRLWHWKPQQISN